MVERNWFRRTEKREVSSDFIKEVLCGQSLRISMTLIKETGCREILAGIGPEATEEELPQFHPLPAVRPLECAQTLVSHPVNTANNNKTSNGLHENSMK